MDKRIRYSQMIGLVAFVALNSFVAAGLDAQEGRFKPMPWHLVDLWWDLGQDRPFESYEIDVSIGNDLPSAVPLYIAPIGLGHLSGTPFYGGLQTQADAHTKASRRIRKIGPGLLMSMWGERSLDAIRPSIGGFCQSSGHEGDFVSVRRAYRWNKGTYTYRIARMDKELIGSRSYTWVGAFVYSHERDENVFVGALRFKGDSLSLSRKIASFVEVYGPKISVGDIPQVEVVFGNVRVNGRKIAAKRVEAIYPEGVPDYAAAAARGREVVIEVGHQVNRGAKRRELLIGN